MVCVSELSTGYINDVGTVCQIGDEMKVLVLDVDDNDRVKLSRRQALEQLGIEDEFADLEADSDGGGDSSDGERSERPSRGGGGGRGRSGGGGRGRSGGGRGRSGGGSGGGGGRDRGSSRR